MTEKELIMEKLENLKRQVELLGLDECPMREAKTEEQRIAAEAEERRLAAQAEERRIAAEGCWLAAQAEEW